MTITFDPSKYPFYVPLPEEAEIPFVPVGQNDVVNSFILAGGLLGSVVMENPAPLITALAVTEMACQSSEEEAGTPIITYKDTGMNAGTTDNGPPTQDVYDITSRRFQDLMDGKLDAVMPEEADAGATEADAGAGDADGVNVADSDGDGEPDMSVEVTPDTELDTETGGLADGTTDVGLEADAADDGVTDAGEETPDNDAVADVDGDGQPDMTVADLEDQQDVEPKADVCTAKPGCTPAPESVVKKEFGGKEYIEVVSSAGKPVTVTFLMSGEYYLCDNPGIGAQQLPEGTTPVAVQYSASQTTSFDSSCYAFACNDISASCLPVKLVIVNNPPVITGVNPVTPVILGNNTMNLPVTVKDPDGDPTKCTTTVKTPKGQLLAEVADALTANEQHILKLPAEKFSLFGKYPASVTCADDKGLKSATADFLLIPTDANALLYLPTDEGSGNVAQDWSGKGLFGVLATGAGWTGGVNGQAVHISGIGPSIDVTANAGNFGAGPFTISAWVFLEPSKTGTRAFVDHRSNTNGYEFFVTSQGLLAFYGKGCGMAAVGPLLNVSKWHHVAATRNEATIQLFLNGFPVMSGTCADNFDNAEILRIGCNTPSIGCTETLNGNIDEVVILNRAMSGAEILTQCNLNDPTGTTCINP